MKRILTTLLAVMMILSVMTACGGRDKNTTSPTPAVNTPSVTTTPAPDDNNTNNDGYVEDDRGNGIIDDAGDAIKDAGQGVENAVDDMLDPNATPEATATPSGK